MIQSPFFKMKLGFIGAGHITQSLIRGLLNTQTITAAQVGVSNRTSGKLKKIQDELLVNTFHSNEELVQFADIIFIAVKPQDFLVVAEEVGRIVNSQQIIISLAAGIPLVKLQKLIPKARWARVMPNTPTAYNQGVVGIYSLDTALAINLSDLLALVGKVYITENEEQLNSLLVGTSSGTGFVIEIMSYLQDWLEEHGFNSKEAKAMAIQTFLGASLISQKHPEKSLLDLINAVASKKGVTAAGLESIREHDMDRLLRMSLDLAQKRNEELARSIV